MRPHNSNNGLILDYCDAQLYNAHKLFSIDDIALQLILYFDEIEVCNPLGGRNGKHKLGELSIEIC